MISFVQPACPFGPHAAWSFGSDSLLCRNAKKMGCLDLSPVIVASGVHEYFLSLPSGCMLNHTAHPVAVWSCSLLLADGIWMEVRCIISGTRILWESCVYSPCNCSVSEGKTVNPSILNHPTKHSSNYCSLLLSFILYWGPGWFSHH